MKESYICDDRNVLENLQKIRDMSDEEFAEYIKSNSTTGVNIDKNQM